MFTNFLDQDYIASFILSVLLKLSEMIQLCKVVVIKKPNKCVHYVSRGKLKWRYGRSYKIKLQSPTKV